MNTRIDYNMDSSTLTAIRLLGLNGVVYLSIGTKVGIDSKQVEDDSAHRQSL